MELHLWQRGAVPWQNLALRLVVRCSTWPQDFYKRHDAGVAPCPSSGSPGQREGDLVEPLSGLGQAAPLVCLFSLAL